MAPGAIVIAVLLVFHLLEKEKKFPVFLVTLVDVSGKAPKNGNNHESIGNDSKDELKQYAGNKGSQQRAKQAGAEDYHIQFVRTISAAHKMLKSGTHPIPQIPQPVSKSVHNVLLGLRFVYIIFQIYRNSTAWKYF